MALYKTTLDLKSLRLIFDRNISKSETITRKFIQSTIKFKTKNSKTGELIMGWSR